jgi:hypothetical protein
VWLSVTLMKRDNLAWTAFALVFTLGAFGATAWAVTTGPYPSFPNRWRPPSTAVIGPESAAAGPMRYAIYHLDTADHGAAYWRSFTPGNTALTLAGGGSLIGYSPLDIQRFRPWFCPGHFGTGCHDAVARATAPVAQTGRSILDLAGVDQVDFAQADDAGDFAARVGAGWSEARNPAGGWRFIRKQPSGLVTWGSADASAKVRSSAPARLVLDASNSAPTQGSLAIARAWYPNWTATLDGRPVTARQQAGLLLTVDLPPRSAGRLVVSFWPAGLTEGLILAAIGLVAVISTGLFPRLLDAPAAWLESRLWRHAEEAA